MTFKDPLVFDFENESYDDMMKRIMDAIEQSPEFNKVRSIEEILDDIKDISLDDYLNEDDDEFIEEEIVEINEKETPKE